MLKFLWLAITVLYVRMRYIPTKMDIRHVISCGEGQCLSEAKEVQEHRPSAKGYIKGCISLVEGMYLINSR